MDKLVILYEQLNTIKATFNIRENKTVGISINNQIKSVEEWIKVLNKGIREIKINFANLLGLDMDTAKLLLAEKALSYAESSEGEDFNLKTRQIIESLLSSSDHIVNNAK